MKKAGNYTSFNPVEDRFEYSKKGIFRCRHKHEALYILLYISGIFLVIIFVIGIANITEPPSLAWLAFGILEIVVPLASPFLLIAGIKVFLSGAFYKYTVDQEKILIVCPKDNYRADIYFENVISVEYSDLVRFGRKYGYHVTVTCRNDIYTYDFIFPHGVRNMPEELTPFRVIEERSGLIAPPEYYGGQRIDNFR